MPKTYDDLLNETKDESCICDKELLSATLDEKLEGDYVLVACKVCGKVWQKTYLPVIEEERFKI